MAFFFAWEVVGRDEGAGHRAGACARFTCVSKSV